MDKTLIKNIISLFGIRGMNYIIPLLTLPYLVTVLGPEGYGTLGFSLAIVHYCSLMTDYGFNLSATKKVAVERDNKVIISRVFWSVIVCKTLMASLSLIIVNLAILSVPKLNDISLIILSGFLIVVGNVLFPSWLFQGKEEMGLVALANISSRLLSIPMIFIFVKSPSDAYLSAMITGITSIIGGVIGLYLVIRNNWIEWYKPNLTDLKEMMFDGWHVFISTIAVSLYTTSTTVILGFISGPVSVGYFVAADKLRQAFQGLVGPISQSFYPRINAKMSKDKNAGIALVRKLLKIQGGGTFLLSVIVFLTSTKVIEVFYGNDYSPSIPVLMILAWLPFVVGLNNVFGIQTLLVLGYKENFSKVLISSGFVNLIFIIPLTTFYNEVGAAISILLTEIVVTILMFLIIVKKRIPLLKGKFDAI